MGEGMDRASIPRYLKARNRGLVGYRHAAERSNYGSFYGHDVLDALSANVEVTALPDVSIGPVSSAGR